MGSGFSDLLDPINLNSTSKTLQSNAPRNALKTDADLCYEDTESVNIEQPSYVITPREPCAPIKMADAGSSNPSRRPLLSGEKKKTRVK